MSRPCSGGSFSFHDEKGQSKWASQMLPMSMEA